jgi:hypothetical protein
MLMQFINTLQSRELGYWVVEIELPLNLVLADQWL